MENNYTINTPNFTGRNVPIKEIAQATKKSEIYIRTGIRQGVFKFGWAIKKGENNYSYFCPDKKVWEEIGYFRDASNDVSNKKQCGRPKKTESKKRTNKSKK